MQRLWAGLQLGAIVGFWLAAWIPMALWCLLAMAIGKARAPHQALP